MNRKRIEDKEEEEDDQSISKKKKKIQSELEMNMEEYDKYLVEKKEGRLKRIGQWSGFFKKVLHECTDQHCLRRWSPCPSQCLTDDYYCPSCVLHHRNNVERFDEERLKWTANVPNTFYVFSLIDPNDQQKTLIKFGRTQNEDPLKRYPTAELKQYQMKLLLNLRGKLISMTKIENYWKEQAKLNHWFVRFSQKDFHGKTECILIDQMQLQQLIQTSKQMAQQQ